MVFRSLGGCGQEKVAMDREGQWVGMWLGQPFGGHGGQLELVAEKDEVVSPSCIFLTW